MIGLAGGTERRRKRMEKDEPERFDRNSDRIEVARIIRGEEARNEGEETIS